MCVATGNHFTINKCAIFQKNVRQSSTISISWLYIVFKIYLGSFWHKRACNLMGALPQRLKVRSVGIRSLKLALKFFGEMQLRRIDTDKSHQLRPTSVKPYSNRIPVNDRFNNSSLAERYLRRSERQHCKGDSTGNCY
jgi:hypothetical protein